MSALPAVCIVTDAARANANLVWAAMGRGPGTFSRKLTTASPALTTSPVTHWLMADSSAQDTDVATWQAFASGVLPSGITWGQNGVIAQASAIAAVSASNLQVYSASGNVVPLDHCNSIMAGRGLSWVPDDI
jgi:hypothetical protein